MGNLKDLASMIPGMGKALKGVEISDDVFKQTEAIIGSMTPAERERPEILNARRRERIAKGSGTTMADVNRLLKQFDDTRKMMKMVAGGGKMKAAPDAARFPSVTHVFRIELKNPASCGSRILPLRILSPASHLLIPSRYERTQSTCRSTVTVGAL